MSKSLCVISHSLNGSQSHSTVSCSISGCHPSCCHACMYRTLCHEKTAPKRCPSCAPISPKSNAEGRIDGRCNHLHLSRACDSYSLRSFSAWRRVLPSNLPVLIMCIPGTCLACRNEKSQLSSVQPWPYLRMTQPRPRWAKTFAALSVVLSVGSVGVGGGRLPRDCRIPASGWGKRSIVQTSPRGSRDCVPGQSTSSAYSYTRVHSYTQSSRFEEWELDWISASPSTRQQFTRSCDAMASSADGPLPKVHAQGFKV